MTWTKLVLAVAVVALFGAGAICWGAGGEMRDKATIAVAPIPPPNNYPTRQVLREAERQLDERWSEKPFEWAGLWIRMAGLRAKLGDEREAREALAKARKAIDLSERGNKYFSFNWRELIKGYARLGDVHAIFVLAETVPERLSGINPMRPVVSGDDIRREMFRSAAEAATEVRQFAAARQLAAALTDPDRRQEVQGRIERRALLHRAKAGDVTGALKALGELPSAVVTAHALVGTVNTNWPFGEVDNPNADDGLAMTQIDAGDRDGARQSTRQALALVASLPREDRSPVTAAAVRVLAKLGDIDATEKELPRIADSELFHRATVFVALAHVRAGQDKAALALATGSWSVEERVFMLHQIGYAQAKAGNREGARASFAKALELVTSYGLSNLGLITVQAASGDFAGATEAAQKSQRHGPSPGYLHNVALYQARAGDFAGAMEYARSRWAISTMILPAIAREQGRRNQDAAARAWIAREEDRRLAVSALVELAEGLYRE